MSDHHSVSYASSGSGGSSPSSSWRERRHKRNEDRRHEWDRERSSLGEGSLQTYWSAFEVLEQEHHDRRDQELERLRRLIRDLELEVRGRCQRRNHNESPEGSMSIRESHGEASRQSGYCQSRERSWEFADTESVSLEWHRHRSAAMDAMSHALHRVAWPPFSKEIEHV